MRQTADALSRGDVCWARLAPRSGSEQQGRRPVVVVSHDGFNRTATWRSVIVVPLSTSATQQRRGPTAVLVTPSDSGLGDVSVALCHQVTTLDRAKLEPAIGCLRSSALAAVDTGLRHAMDLDIQD